MLLKNSLASSKSNIEKEVYTITFHGDICSNNAVLCTYLFNKISGIINTPPWK